MSQAVNRTMWDKGGSQFLFTYLDPGHWKSLFLWASASDQGFVGTWLREWECRGRIHLCSSSSQSGRNYCYWMSHLVKQQKGEIFQLNNLDMISWYWRLLIHSRSQGTPHQGKFGSSLSGCPSDKLVIIFFFVQKVNIYGSSHVSIICKMFLLHYYQHRDKQANRTVSICYFSFLVLHRWYLNNANVVLGYRMLVLNGIK